MITLWMVLACRPETVDTDVTSVYDDPLFDSLAPATLPYALHPEDAVHPRSLYFTSGVTTLQTHEPLVAVAALDDLVAVVYPDAEQGRALAIAWAELDGGWQRQVLATNDRLLEDVDAISAGDTVHIATRTSDGVVRHLTWTRPTPGGTEGAVTTEDVAITSVGTTMRACADLALGVDPQGEVDLLWQGERTLQHGHRDGSGAWVTTDALPVEGWGCRNMLEYDESGLPYAMSTARTYYDVPNGDFVDMTGERNEVATLKWGANGRFQSGGTLAYRLFVPNVSPPDESEFRGYGWLDTHPLSGAVLGGTAFDEVRLGFEFFSPSEVFVDNTFDADHPNPFWFDCRGDCYLTAGFGGSFDVVGADLDDCGRMVLFYQNDGQPQSIRAQTFEDRVAGCESSNHAPVLWREEDRIAAVDMERAVFTHGQRPYSAAVCTSTQGVMTLCYGGFGEQLSRAHSDGHWGNLGTALLAEDGPPLIAREDIPEFTFASVSADVPVPVDIGTIEVAYSNVDFDLPASQEVPDIRPVLRDVYWGIDSPETTIRYDAATGRATLTLASELKPGHTYRIDLVGQHPQGQYMELQGRGLERFVSFTAEGALPGRADPRDSPTRGLELCSRRESGLCILTRTAGSTELNYGEEVLRGWPEPTATPVVRAPDGRVISGVTTWSNLGLGFSVALSEPLATGTGNYVLELPEMYDWWGVRVEEPVEIEVVEF